MHIFDLARADMEVKEGKKFWHSMYVYRCLGPISGEAFFFIFMYLVAMEKKSGK